MIYLKAIIVVGMLIAVPLTFLALAGTIYGLVK